MSTIQINTTQNVNIDFKLASFGESFLAGLIDVFVILSYVYIVSTILSSLGINAYNMDFWSYVAIQSVLMLPAWMYTLWSELFFRGQTLGKMVLKIKVVKVDGYSASFIDFFIRWIIRAIDVWFLFAVVVIVFIISSKNSQRLGGLASGTAVISLRNKYKISSTILENLESNYVPTYPSVINLTDKDMQLIKDLFQTARKSNDAAMMEKLRIKVENVTKYSKQNLSDAAYISTVIKDYTHYTQDMV
ncbi:MAG: RDD family protein [Marinilabiliales bacterium]|nr:MAG: RDD family protein [Marinilabiliales bacterium]